MSREAQSLAVGINAVIAALRADAGAIRRVLVHARSANQRVRDVEMLAADQGVEVQQVSRDELDQLAAGALHQDVVAELYPRAGLGEADIGPLLDKVPGDPLLLVLDGVQDPHNLGACLRTAEAAGVHAVIIPKDKAVGLTPVVRRAAAGAAEVVPLVTVTNLARTLRTLKERGIWLCGTSGTARVSLYHQDLKGPLALVMGAEGKGLRRLTEELCDFLVHIPMAGMIESLNVSVATGVCLFEAGRQRRIG